MSSRLAQLAARLDAMSRAGSRGDEHLRVARWGFGLAVPLPPEVVAALALREGDPIEVRVPDQLPFRIIVTRVEAVLVPPG
jgi:hypothetical protein